MIDKPTGAALNPFSRKFSTFPRASDLAARAFICAVIATSFIAVWLPRENQVRQAEPEGVHYVTLPRVEIVGQREHGPDVVAQAGKPTPRHD